MDDEGELNCQLFDKSGKEIYNGPIDSYNLQKSTKYAITMSRGENLNIFRNLKLTFIENLQKKQKKGNLYNFKGHSQNFDPRGVIEKGIFKKGKYEGSLQAGQVIDLSSGLLREYTDETQPNKSSSAGKSIGSNLESVTVNKKFFKGKFFNLVDPQPSESKVQIDELASIQELSLPFCRYGCYTLGIPKFCAFKNEMGDKIEKEFGQCTTIKMLTGLKDLQSLL